MKIKEINFLTLYEYYQLQINIPKTENRYKIKALADELSPVDTTVDYEIKIAKKRNKRSLSANGYAWHLINEIANVLRTGKDEVYLEMLKRYGQSEIISVKADIDISGFIKYYDVFGKGEVDGKQFTHYKIYKGSSEYNSKEMSIFIDGIVSEAKELNIETLDDKMINTLVSELKAVNK